MAKPISRANQLTIQEQTGAAEQQPLALRHLSHDLRGPLNSILGFSELLLDGVEGPLTEMQSEDIAAIRHSAKDLLRLINTMVDLSKLAADDLNLELAEVSLPAVWRDVEATLKQERPIDIKVDLPPALPSVVGDADRIKQIVFNIVHFLVNKEKAKSVVIGFEAGEADGTLQIAAPEVFIPTAQVETLFELTVRIDSQGHSKLTYGGLELPLAWQLAAKQEGGLWVASSEEAGTTFYLKLSLAAV